LLLLPIIDAFITSNSIINGKRSHSKKGLRSKIDKRIEVSHEILSKKRVLVVGGSGRVGGSVVTQLVKHGGFVTVGGTSEESFRASRKRWAE